MTADIVLWLDLAQAHRMHERTVRDAAPARATILRATEFGVQPSGDGGPPDWPSVLDAIDRMVHRARQLARHSPECRYHVTGRAGLPAFVYLGHHLGDLARITFIHQPQNAIRPVKLALDPVALPADTPPYFDRAPWPIPASDAKGPVALVVSCPKRPPDKQIHEAIADRQARAAAIVYAHSSAWLDETGAQAAIPELRARIRDIDRKHPGCTALCIFVWCPTPLAFALGTVLTPGTGRAVQVFQYDAGRYSVAYELPCSSVLDRAVAE